MYIYVYFFTYPKVVQVKLRHYGKLKDKAVQEIKFASGIQNESEK